jgi:hypothetical protein
MGKIIISILFLLCFASCASQRAKPIKEIENEGPLSKDVMNEFERKVIGGCPISEGPLAVIKYLEELEGFHRNKEIDYGNGSVRFNAKNAEIYDRKLFDNKSVFLLNYNIANPTYEGWILFHTIYWFEEEEEKHSFLEYLITVFSEDLNLNKTTKSDLIGKPYSRYTLSNGSQFNFKHGSRGGKHFIDILWAPKPK